MFKTLLLKKFIENDFAFTHTHIYQNHLSDQIEAKKINFGFVSPQLLIQNLTLGLKSLKFVKKINQLLLRLACLCTDNHVEYLQSLLLQREIELKTTISVLNSWDDRHFLVKW